MIVALLIILVLVLALPFVLRIVESNLEFFLFIMGLAAVIASGAFSLGLIEDIFKNYFMYIITAAVLIFDLLFIKYKQAVTKLVDRILFCIPLSLFIFLLITILGLSASLITAIIAALLLVEIINILPVKRKEKVTLDIIACFSIGLGAVLTPVGEPLATIVVSRLNKDFLYLFRELSVYVIPGIIILGVSGALYIKRARARDEAEKALLNAPPGRILTAEKQGELEEELEADIEGERIDKLIELEELEEPESFKDALLRAVKIFVFVFALELLGAGFKPLIDTYVVMLDNKILYWLNMISAVLDNATLASAEISPKMSDGQIMAILMGLLISGGMLIPGNIPNIISAGKLKIKSNEWGRLGVPMGLAIMGLYFIVIFLI